MGLFGNGKMKTYEAKEQKIIVQVLLAAFLAAISSPYLPHDIQRGFLTMSVFIKEVIIMILPLIIFSSVFNAISNLPKTAFKIVFVIIATMTISNSLVLIFSGSFAYLFSSYITINNNFSIHNLTPLININFPKIFHNEYFLIMGFVIGSISKYFDLKKLVEYNTKLHEFSNYFVSQFFVPLLPIFVFGFLLKLISDGVIHAVLMTNIAIIGYMCLGFIFYTTLMYLIALNFDLQRLKAVLYNVLPPAIAGFSSMSSVSALPLSIESAKKNTGNGLLSQVVMPTTVNIHMIGDGIAIPVFVIIIMKSFNMPMPDISTYLTFVIFYIAIRFSGAGVPGGTILIIIPILEKVFGFNSEMIGIITTLYILFDPLITSFNVLGNNALVLFISKSFNKCVKLG